MCLAKARRRKEKLRIAILGDFGFQQGAMTAGFGLDFLVENKPGGFGTHSILFRLLGRRLSLHRCPKGDDEESRLQREGTNSIEIWSIHAAP